MLNDDMAVMQRILDRTRPVCADAIDHRIRERVAFGGPDESISGTHPVYWGETGGLFGRRDTWYEIAYFRWQQSEVRVVHDDRMCYGCSGVPSAFFMER